LACCPELIDESQSSAQAQEAAKAAQPGSPSASSSIQEKMAKLRAAMADIARNKEYAQEFKAILGKYMPMFGK
jgi:hypothetical protein